jgi:dihydroorotase
MPNLVPPIVDVEAANSYRARILSALPKDTGFDPLMTLYLSQNTTFEDVQQAAASQHIKAFKLYPAGATTNSDSGVSDFAAIMPILEKMAELAVPLCVHGEVTDASVDIFDREAVFIEKVLDPIRKSVPQLRIIFEHITTIDGVEYVRGGGENIAATITTHHLIINRNQLLVGGIHPHYYCLPIAKRERHRLALVDAATSGEASFFLGTDSAPHLDGDKQSACGCAGIFSATNTIACLAHVFEDASALTNLEAFTSRYGPQFYNLPLNTEKIVLTKNSQPIDTPQFIKTPNGNVTIFDPGFPLLWQVA